MVASAPNMSTYDASPPHRPGLDDFEGAAMVNDSRPGHTPIAGEMPTAELFNTTERTVISHGKMTAVAFACVIAGVSSSIEFWATAANNIISSPFTLTRTAGGDYNLTWPAGTFPTANGRPRAHLNVVLGAHNYAVGAVAITNGVRITTTQDGALTDLNFTVEIF